MFATPTRIKLAGLTSACGIILLHLVSSMTQSACASDVKSATEDLPPVQSVEDLEVRIQAILDGSNIPGLTGAIVYGNDIVWQATLGIADLEAGRSVTHETPFRVGSISKTFLSLAVLKLVERGVLQLTDTVESLAPKSGIVNPWAATHPVRLVHLLEHTSGLPDVGLRGQALDDPDLTTRQGLDVSAASRELLWRPGTRMAYSNLGPIFAALVVEHVSGRTFEEFVEEEVFGPLGMKSATYFYTDNTASSYNAGGRIPYRHISRPSGGAGLTSDDMIQLLRMFNHRGTVNETTLLKPHSIARMETPTTTLAAQAGLRVGYGLGNYTYQENGFVFQGHGGGIGGFVSRYAYLPEAGRGYFVSINARNVAAFENIVDEIIAFITKDLTPLKKPELVKLTEQQLRQFEGTYLRDSLNSKLNAGIQRLQFRRVKSRAGGLFFGPMMSLDTELKPVGGKRFMIGDDPLPSAIFVKSPDGDQLLQIGDSTLRRVSPWIAYTPIIALISSVLVLMTTLLFAPMWIIRKLLGRMKDVRYLSVRVLPLVAVGTLIAMFVFLRAAPSIDALPKPTLWSVGVWISSLLFAIFAGLSLLNTSIRFRQRKEIGRFVWYHSLLTSLALMTLTVILNNAGFIGLRTWAC